ncbi:hypothetical protein [Haloplanus sp. C73]|uniref:hypothetical protein n=1 Tax=Haloplanus sp. C73 TaxID=3421641 RepID=UPI003EBF83DB
MCNQDADFGRTLSVVGIVSGLLICGFFWSYWTISGGFDATCTGLDCLLRSERPVANLVAGL